MEKRETEDGVAFPQTDFKVTIEFGNGTIYSGRAKEGCCYSTSELARIVSGKLEVASWDEGGQKFGPLELIDWDITRNQKRPEIEKSLIQKLKRFMCCLLYTSPSPRDRQKSRMPSSA